ncbi:Response regulator receiver domain-containing protein [Mesorhizobium sp. NFR06]|uniref:response regulator n=1 Tax=Mesorhizobium sp. NFR06 TaxID=1566290 RepID=UPI0008EA6F64|nr:response regulator [Mesorhizobium sp. NFR06]SFQ19653.1 Response regulator receiver domain-containing protein [Mesorhizobium sp. NFR06]
MDDGEILVVEDEVLILLDVEAALQEAGFRVSCEHSAAAAMAAFDAEPEKFRGLVTDIQLGRGGSGWDLARHVRATNPVMPVVYVSGNSAGDWPVEGVPNSIMISKPFFTPQIVTALATLLNGQPPASS